MRLLKIELHKLWTYRAFWWLFGAYLVFLGLSLVAMQGITNKVVHNALPVSTTISIYFFPDIWHYLAWLGGWFRLLLAVLLIFLVCNEFTYKTLRQQVINGLSRWEFFKAKVLLILMLSLVSTVIIFLVGMVLGNIYSGIASPEVVFQKIDFVLAYFVSTTGFLMLAFLVAFLVQRSAIAIGIFFMYVLVAEPLLRYFLPAGIGPWMPAKAVDGIVQFPLNRYINLDIQEHVAAVDLGLAIVYTILFGMGVMLLLRKRDL